VLQPLESAHPISGAIRNLPAHFPWPISLVERPAEDKVRLAVTPLFGLPAGDSVWSESEWLRVWQTPKEQRTTLSELPVFDEGRDGRFPSGRAGEGQRWTIASAVERNELGSAPQRAIIVGSNTWYIDQITQRQTAVDGRAVIANPGNLEFFEASVYWLAGQDELIAQSPTARSVAVIKAIDETRLSQIRAALILGLPMLVLAVGGLFRLVRG
jgi:hypothetical protein